MPTKKDVISPITIIALLLFSLIAGYFYYAQALKDSGPVVILPLISPNDTLAKFANINLDFSIFSDSAFRSLKVIGESPITPGSTGRIDIFAPF